MKIITAILILCLCAGCGRKKNGDGTSTSKYQTTALPVPPPVPDVTPVSAGVDSITTHANVAQKNVQGVLGAAKTSDAPIAQQAIAPLTTADNELTALKADAVATNAAIVSLKESIRASDEAAKQTAKIQSADMARFQKDCKAEVDALVKENQDLKNEQINKAKTILFWAGIGCTFLGIGCIVSFFMLTFGAGKVLGPCFLVMGTVCVWLSAHYEAVMWWTGWAIGVAVVVGLIVTAYHLFHHDPKPLPTAEEV